MNKHICIICKYTYKISFWKYNGWIKRHMHFNFFHFAKLASVEISLFFKPTSNARKCVFTRADQHTVLLNFLIFSNLIDKNYFW